MPARDREGHEPAIRQRRRCPRLSIFDHVGFKGAACRTNLSFLYLGDFWNDRISSLIVVSGVWRFYRDEYYKGDHWDLGPGFYECFFKDKGPDDVISSFKAVARPDRNARRQFGGDQPLRRSPTRG